MNLAGRLRLKPFSCMAINALEFCQVAQIDRVCEGPASFVARGAIEPRQLAEVYGMFERSVLCGCDRPVYGLIERRVADVTISANDFACAADMLAVMATETARVVVVADVVRVSAPVNLHFRKDEGLKNAL